MVNFEREINEYLDEQSKLLENLNAQEVKEHGFELLNLFYKSILNSRIGKEELLSAMFSHTIGTPQILKLTGEKHTYHAFYVAKPKQVGIGSRIFSYGGLGTNKASLDNLRGSLTAAINVFEIVANETTLIEKASVKISDSPATFENAEITYYNHEDNLTLQNTKTAVFKTGELFERFSDI